MAVVINCSGSSNFGGKVDGNGGGSDIKTDGSGISGRGISEGCIGGCGSSSRVVTNVVAAILVAVLI